MGLSANAAFGLDQTEISETLTRLHARAKADGFVFLSALPSVAWGAVRGRGMFESAEPHLKSAYIPVSPFAGRFMYQIARAAGSKHIVEFGTSFGISAIYLSAAAQANGGKFTGSEKETKKAAIARRNIAEAGLARVADIRDGDAMESLSSLESGIDFLFLDGWKDLYIPILQMLEPKLAPGAIVLADNLKTFKKTLKPFADYLSVPANGYEVSFLPFESGLAFATWRGS